MKIICFYLVVLLLSACATHQQKVNLDNVTTQAQGIFVVSNHPEVINTYIKPLGGKTAYCLEPDPDMVTDFGDSLSLGSTQGANNATISGSEKGSSVTTGGLSPMVLIVREMMYRACELSMNTNATKAESKAIYNDFLQVIDSIAKVLNSSTGTAPSQPSATQ